jgi:diguanylate cyclase (GGDEF)-like protein
VGTVIGDHGARRPTGLAGRATHFADTRVSDVKLQLKILLLLPFIIAPLAGLGFVAIGQLDQLSEDLAYARLSSLAERLALDLRNETTLVGAEARRLVEQVDNVLAAARNGQIVDRSDYLRLLGRQQKANPNQALIALDHLDPDVKLQMGDASAARRSEIAELARRMRSSAKAGGSTIVPSADGSDPEVVGLYRFVPADDSATDRGYVAIWTKAAVSVRKTLQAAASDHVALLVADGRGHIAYRSALGKRVDGEDLPESAFAAVHAADAHSAAVPIQFGEPFSAAVTHLVGEDFFVVAAMSDERFGAGRQDIRRLLISSFVGLTVIAALLTYLFLRRNIVKPVEKLGEVAQEFGKGNMLVKIDVSARDEFGQLAMSLREMGRNLRQSSKQVRYFAYHDSLTKLPNRLMFGEYLEHSLANARRHKQLLALLFIDLDNFKRINDTLGHQAGDFVLKEFANRLNHCLRADDYVGRPNQESKHTDTVARLGGDEFTVLLPNISGPYKAANVAKRILEAVADPFIHDGQELHVGASIGITIYPNDGADGDTMIKNADVAMYHAKEHGNTYQYYRSSMNAAAFERLTLEAAMRKAIDRNEFVLHYHPQLDLATGRITCFEALIRWQHPEHGVTYPEKFIPIAEEAGIIVPIGEWIMETACRQLKAWHDAGHPELSVAVNVSGVQFNRQDLARLVEHNLRAHGLRPGALEIELTETTIMRAEDKVAATLDAIRDLGVRIAMDDFGTGYSSLNFLRKFPIDRIKVDRSFVRDITTDPEDAAIIAAILSMAASLRLDVVAEGVETQAQVDFLRAHACRYIQGYLVSRPLTVERVVKWLNQSQAATVSMR